MNRIAFMYPGQGSQEMGMYSDIYNQSSLVRKTYEEASQILSYELFELLQKMDSNTLSQLSYSTPAIFVGGVALYRYITKELGINPMILCGHSLGECTALTCAEFIDFETGLKLVMKRAELAEKVRKKTNSGMLVISKVSFDIVEKICTKFNKIHADVHISCYNSDYQTCIVGSNDNLYKLAHILRAKGAITKFLINNAPYHSSMMEEVKIEFEEYLAGIKTSYPRLPVCSDYYGKVYTPDNFRELLICQLTKPVMWFTLIDKLLRQNINEFIELSNKPILVNLMKYYPGSPKAYSYYDMTRQRDAFLTNIKKEK